MQHNEISLLHKTGYSLLGCFVLFWFIYAAGEQFGYQGVWLTIFAFTSSFVCLATALFYFVSFQQKQLDALHDGIKSFKDGDFSIRIHPDGDKHLAPILNLYNDLARNLTEQRQTLSQKEHLLDSIVQASPMAIVLFNPFKQVVYHNQQANELLQIKGTLKGKELYSLLDNVNNPIATFLLEQGSGIVSFEHNDLKHSYYIANQTVTYNHQPHQLVLCKDLSIEIGKEELQLWKNAIRLISHELNNSLAPISSLTSSAEAILVKNTHLDLLPDILQTINQRASNLNVFIAKYAEFARLPKPNISKHSLASTLQSVQRLYSFELLADLPCEYAYFDVLQLEQVLINLLKNAHESGSKVSDIGIKVVKDYDRVRFAIVDRGQGITQGKISQVTLPFFSTKQGGSGLGLSICSEVINAHQGQLKIKNRSNGGVMVEFDIPLKIFKQTT
ncbi:MAG: histidine kinase [Flavobacteriaceae bacterium]|nr:histidine kinase [Flavobacteriaceae bacterium]|tara:strand:+ start:604 stop:1938 length:1335 start_codon:yes stop_codon:yes gene_type:complete